MFELFLCLQIYGMKQHKLTINLPKKNETNISPAWTEQTSSIKGLLLWLNFKFPSCIAHLYRWKTYCTRKKHCFYCTVFAEVLPNLCSDNKERVFTQSQKVSIWISFHKTQISETSCERSISLVHNFNAKYGPLREPIRMFLFPAQPYNNAGCWTSSCVICAK